MCAIVHVVLQRSRCLAFTAVQHSAITSLRKQVIVPARTIEYCQGAFRKILPFPVLTVTFHRASRDPQDLVVGYTPGAFYSHPQHLWRR